MGADNQQERLDASWVVGFVDGEGCFRVSINRQPAMSLRWQVLPEFRVVQHERDERVLQKLTGVFGCGSVVRNHGNRKEFRVRGLQNLTRVVDFFRKHPLQTTKQKNFEQFAQIIELMQEGQHGTRDGIDTIAHIAWNMNRQLKPRYLESSETIR